MPGTLGAPRGLGGHIGALVELWFDVAAHVRRRTCRTVGLLPPEVAARTRQVNGSAVVSNVTALHDCHGHFQSQLDTDSTESANCSGSVHHLDPFTAAVQAVAAGVAHAR